MGKFVLLTDVQCEMDRDHLIVGPSESSITEEGADQARQIAKFLGNMFATFDAIVASDSSRVTKLLHQIRMSVKVKQPRVRYNKLLAERNFGVLNGTRFLRGLQSDIFTHSRICAEGGESVAQCVERSMKLIKSTAFDHDEDIVCVTHPFLAQIICNSIMNKKQTILTEFWMKKGSFMVLSASKGMFTLKAFWNAVEETQYSTKEVYGDLL